MKEDRKRVQIRLPPDIINTMKLFLSTREDNNFYGDSLSVYIEMLIRDDVEAREKLELESLVNEK